MIEVEHRFLLTPEEQTRLLDGAVFQWEKTYTDTYYDTADYRVTCKDWWLRNRSGRFELKIGRHADRPGMTDAYEELDDDHAIVKALDIAASELSDAVLREHGFSPFCILATKRRHYTKDGFGIDIDETTSDNYHFSCTEIELMVATQEEGAAARERIREFAKHHGIETRAFRGKVFEYLYRFRPEQYQALVAAKVINS